MPLHPKFVALLSNIDGVLFDMDGVLLDTENLYTVATQQVLGELGHRFDWRVKEKIMGRAALESARILLSAVGSDLTPEDYIEKRRPILMDLFRTNQAKPGAPELVQALAERGLPMAVATSSDRQFFELKTGHHPWFSSFQAIVCGSDAEVGRHKPAPDIFLEAARRINVPPERCLIFEDSAAGVEAGRNAAAAQVVAIADPNIDRRLLAAADLIVDSWTELLA